MRKITTVASSIALTGLFLSLGLASASAVDGEDVQVSSVISGGLLSATTPGPATMDGVTLDGVTAKVTSGTPADSWEIVNARGTDTAWNLTASATNFTSAAGTAEGERSIRTIDVANLLITPGTVTAGEGSDVAPETEAVQMTGAAQSLVTMTSTGKGTYTLAPEFTLTVPANAFRSNIAADDASVLVPYISTITFTIG
jgi:hypothetical protein